MDRCPWCLQLDPIWNEFKKKAHKNKKVPNTDLLTKIPVVALR